MNPEFDSDDLDDTDLYGEDEQDEGDEQDEDEQDEDEGGDDADAELPASARIQRVRLRSALGKLHQVMAHTGPRAHTPEAGAVHDAVGTAVEYLNDAHDLAATLPKTRPAKMVLAAGQFIKIAPEQHEKYAYLGDEVLNSVGQLVNDSPGRGRWIVNFSSFKTVLSGRDLIAAE